MARACKIPKPYGQSAWMAAKREFFGLKLALRYFLKRKPPKKPVFILCSERTGSSLFISYLNTHPEVWLLGDILCSRLENGLRRTFMPKRAALNYVRYFLNYLHRPIAGAKFFFTDLRMRRITLQDLHRHFPRAKWLVLYRENTFDQYLSHKMAIRTNRWSQRENDPEAPAAKVKISPRSVRGYHKRMRRYYQSILDFPEIREKSLWISYEELAQDPQKIFNESVFPFLEAAPVSVHTDRVKQNARPRSEAIENYEEIKPVLGDKDFTQRYERFPCRKTADEIRIRKLEPGDFESLAELNPWELKTQEPRYPEWLHHNCLLPGISWVAAVGPKIVGYFGTAAIRLKVQAKSVPCYRGELFVHPHYRGHKYGIFKRLVHAVFDEVKEKQGVIYGLPLTRLVSFYEKMVHGRILKIIPNYVYTPGPARFLSKLFSREKSPGDFKILEISFFDGRFDSLWEKVSQAHTIIADRSAAYLNWRYFKEPGKKYLVFAAQKGDELLGYLILRTLTPSGSRVGSIVDLLDMQEPAVTRALLRHAIDYFMVLGAEKIKFQYSNDYYENRLRECGFKKRTGKPVSGEIFLVKNDSPEIDREVFMNPQNWLVNSADILMA
jgi:GNAT superfamily N-acetyltransferase